MKVAVNCVFFQPQAGGIREYIAHLIENLANPEIGGEDDYVLYMAEDFEQYARSQWNALPPNFRLKTVPFRGSGLMQRIRRSLFSGRYWRREEQLEGWDIFHSPFFHSPLGLRCRVVLTVHDLRLERYPESYARLRRVFLRYVVRRSVRKADAIIAVSDFTRRELLSAYGNGPRGIDASKITVIHEGLNAPPPEAPVGERSVADVLPPGARFLLSVGHLEPRKNYLRLIEAFDKVTQRMEDPDLRLVIVGRRGHDYARLLQRISRHPRVDWLDFVTPSQLQDLYRRATLLVFPSYYEGFGFPPLEAAAEQTPAVVSHASSMPEICGDGALYFDPFDTDDMAEAIFRALTDRRLPLHLLRRMQLRLPSFSWRRNARLTHNLYHSLH